MATREVIGDAVERDANDPTVRIVIKNNTGGDWWHKGAYRVDECPAEYFKQCWGAIIGIGQELNCLAQVPRGKSGGHWKVTQDTGYLFSPCTFEFDVPDNTNFTYTIN